MADGAHVIFGRHPPEVMHAVTAKLSRRFYETSGDQIADEPVDWLNQVDATYRTELHELNELNFARFDARLEQRAAGIEAKLEQRTAELGARLEQRIAELRGEVLTEIHAVKAELITWMFLFWLGTIGTVLALQQLRAFP